MVDEEEEQKEGNDSEGRDDELWLTVVKATVGRNGTAEKTENISRWWARWQNCFLN